MSTKVSLIGLAVAGLVYSHPPPWTHADGWDEPWHGSKHDGSKSDANLVDTDLTILTHDDLYGNMSSRTDAAIVLSDPLTNWQAWWACTKLGEKPWHSGRNGSDVLEYLAFKDQNGPYWVAGHEGRRCSTVTANGATGSAQCGQRLPALCTQSAPLSNLTFADNSTKWQTSVMSGQQSFTGFRDKFSFRFEGLRYAPEPELFTYSSLYHGRGHSDALSFGSQCVQAGGIGSTDCLFLNIWTPYLPSGSGGEDKLRPVMFWIHGGGFTSGYGSDSTFDGGSLVARGDVVVVTINYRLGTLGFLALDDGVTNGNFGLADQITALNWVHEHIKAFGGDPERITIFGQSAGAASVRALMASPVAIGKYAAAVPQSNLAGSGYAEPYSRYYTIEEEVALAADPILNATGCSNATSQVDCLRGIDPHALANLTTSARYLVQDGTYLTTDGLEVTGRGPTAHVPTMMGFMRDDGAAFISYPQANGTLASSLAMNGFNMTPTTTSLFPMPNGANETLNIFNTTSLVATDSLFRCLDEATAYSAVLHDVIEPIYFYEFNRSYQLTDYSPNAPVCEAPIQPGFPDGNPDAEYFKCHSGELYYVFGNIVFNGLPIRDENDIPMSQFIVDTWSSFARTYDPNPDVAYLEARGFTNTTAGLARSRSRWTPVSSEDLSLRLLQYPSEQADFGIYAGQEQCRALRFGIDYYETQQ